MKLDRDTLLQLSAVIWATGEVVPASVAALLEVARVCGLQGDDLRAIEAAAQHPVATASIAPLALDARQRRFAYGVATWLARANNTLLPSEQQALALLGDRLGLPRPERARVAAAARAIGDATDGNVDHDVLALARVLDRDAG